MRTAPGYVLTELNPIYAIDVHYGNCFAKAMLASGIIVMRHGVEPSVFYKASAHGQTRERKGNVLIEKPVDPATGKTMAHITVLAPGVNEAGEDKIVGIHFGAKTKRAISPADRTQALVDEVLIWEDFNRLSEDAIVKPSGEIAATPESRRHGMVAGNWRHLGQAYLTALDRQPFDFDLLLERIADRKVISLPEPLDPAS